MRVPGKEEQDDNVTEREDGVSSHLYSEWRS